MIAILNIIYLIKISDSDIDAMKLYEKKLIKIMDNQKKSEAITQLFLIQLKSLLRSEDNKKNKQINVIDISGIAGPVSNDSGNKYNKRIDIFLKSNLK